MTKFAETLNYAYYMSTVLFVHVKPMALSFWQDSVFRHKSHALLINTNSLAWKILHMDLILTGSSSMLSYREESDRA